MAQLIKNVSIAPVNGMAVPGAGSDSMVIVCEIDRDLMLSWGIDADDIVIKCQLVDKDDAVRPATTEATLTKVADSNGRFWRGTLAIATGTTAGDFWLRTRIGSDLELDPDGDGTANQTLEGEDVSVHVVPYVLAP